MEIFDLIAERPLIWGLFLLYMAGTSWLAWLGHKKTTDISSFAIGKGDMNPVVVGITLAASIASTATFVINPGFVYVHGMSAFNHLGVAVLGGVGAGLVVMSVKFRRIGVKSRALTIPQWVAQRYGVQWFGALFALINLLSVTFIVLIVGGLSIVMQQTLGLGNLASLVLIVGFVFSYVFVGGTYAHAYTNTLQGGIMIGVTLLILASGLPLLADGFGPLLDKIAAVDPNLVTAVNPTSPLFSSPFTVFVSGAVIGFALVCQPHILTKALYVKDDKAVWQYLAVALTVFALFSALLVVGLYAHGAGLTREDFVDPNTGAFRQDMVMTVYLTKAFSPGVVAVVTVALMAAGMSTLDGILVSLSSIVANDLLKPITDRMGDPGRSEEDKSRAAYRMSQGVLVLLGVAAFVIALDPPKLLGIFGQVGVYGIVSASTAPILLGILFPQLGARTAVTAAIVGIVAHFGLYAWGSWAVDSGVDLVASYGAGFVGAFFDSSAPQFGLRNPGVCATYGVLLSLLVSLPGLVTSRQRAAAA